MRNFTAITLLVLFTISQAGNYFALRFQQKRIKSEMKSSLVVNASATSIVLIEEDNPAIRWEEKGDEFYMNGELFDVIETKTINGKKILYCLPDQKEKELLQDYAKAISPDEEESSNKAGKHSVKLRETDIIVKEVEHLLFGSTLSIFYFPHLDTHLTSSPKSIIIPPPRFIA